MRFIQTTLRLSLTAAILMAAMLPQAATADVYYVKPSASGGGTSWGDAGDLEAMITASTAGDEIWVFEGTYLPLHKAGDGTLDRDRAFVLKAGVKIYGGFNIEVPAGTVPAFGAAGRAGESTLSGDLGTPGSDTDNAYHVVICANIGNATVLDGFTVSGGNAGSGSPITVNGQPVSREAGGGIYNYDSSPVLTGVTIRENRADYGGGGIYNAASSPVLTGVTISGNSTNGSGGGIHNVSCSPSPVLTRVSISENTANGDGGGIYNWDSSPVLTGVTISGNQAINGGGICNNSSSPVLTGVTISGNRAYNYGGGISNTSSSPKLINVTISGNGIEFGGGGGISNTSSSPELTNTIVWGNDTGVAGSGSPTYNYCLVQGVTTADANGNLDGTTDPLFVSLEAATSSGPTTGGDYRLTANSPVTGKGSNASYWTSRGLPPSSFTGETDLAGLPRLSGSTIDMGAYEYPLTVPGEPAGFTATPGNGEVVLAWAVPADCGGSAITGYDVSIDGSWVAVPALHTDTVITGLINGTQYTFRVRAKNEMGDGAATAGISATPASYGVTLAPPAPYTFPSAAYGYGAGDDGRGDERTPLTVTVANSGTLPTGPLTVAVTGIGPDTFLLSRAALGSIPVAGSDTFALAPATGLAAGPYAATVTVAGGNGITASFAVSFTVDKAAPTDAELDFDLSDIVHTGKPLPGIGVGAAAGIEGLGEVTVKYDGFTAIPTLPGTYTVTVDIAAGDNYLAIEGLVLGTFTVYDLPMPVIRRRVTLPSAPGLTTDPPANTYYISSGSDFTFTLTPDVPSPAGTPPQVQTNRAGVPDSSTGIRMTPNADGSYTVVIAAVRQDIDVILSIPADNAPVADGALTVGTAPGVLVVANGRPDAVTLHVYNLAGTLVRRTAVPPGTTRLSVATGIYIVTDGGTFYQKRVVTR